MGYRGKSDKEYQRNYYYKTENNDYQRCVNIIIKIMILYKNIKENII